MLIIQRPTIEALGDEVTTPNHLASGHSTQDLVTRLVTHCVAPFFRRSQVLLQHA